MNVRFQVHDLRIDRARGGRAHERGAVLVALGAIALSAAAALGIDGGRLFLKVRYAQAAEDHAAITASWTRCTGATVNRAIQDGLAAAARNGYGNDGVTNTVSVAWAGGRQFLATVTSTIPATFARVIGVATFRRQGGSPERLHGWRRERTRRRPRRRGLLHQEHQREVPAGRVRVEPDDDRRRPRQRRREHRVRSKRLDERDRATGPLHLRGHDVAQLEPTRQYFRGGVSPRRRALPARSAVAGRMGASDAASKVAELEAIAAANGTLSSSNVTSLTQNGVIATTHPDGMDITSIDPSVDTVTLVARNGPIKISASNVTVTAPTDGILMLATPTYGTTERCHKFSIAISGQASHWIGLIWGPTGLVEFSGSDGSSVDGSLIGCAVRLNGSNITIAYTPDPSPDEPDVQLLQR